MKKSYLYLSILAMLYLFACEENFSPIGDYREEYILNCVIRGDTNVQVVTLSRNYFSDGFNPYLNTEDPTLKGADVRIWDSPDDIYICRDTIIERPFDSRYETPLYYYFVDTLAPKFNRNMEIEVILTDGRKMRAKTKTPEEIAFNRNSQNLFDMEGDGLVNVSWVAQEADIYYLPNYTFAYFTEINGHREKFKVKVPIEYVQKDNEFLPVYPKASPNPTITYDREVLTRILNKLSEGDSDKSKYSILIKNDLDLLIMDQNLSSYLIATEDALDAFTVRLDEADFSNVEGGLGIFGSYFKINYWIYFSREYIESFGYKPVFE
jgi:hypothetical protein